MRKDHTGCDFFHSFISANHSSHPGPFNFLVLYSMNKKKLTKTSAKIVNTPQDAELTTYGIYVD